MTQITTEEAKKFKELLVEFTTKCRIGNFEEFIDSHVAHPEHTYKYNEWVTVKGYYEIYKIRLILEDGSNRIRLYGLDKDCLPHELTKVIHVQLVSEERPPALYDIVQVKKSGDIGCILGTGFPNNLVVGQSFQGNFSDNELKLI